ncbi:hypothetical protein C8R43DRAFT_1047646 [Mycena crocata]|nr:hypothetical protein C8R43DRAFT_1047646 [Mycena crocata]
MVPWRQLRGILTRLLTLPAADVRVSEGARFQFSLGKSWENLPFLWHMQAQILGLAGSKVVVAVGTAERSSHDGLGPWNVPSPPLTLATFVCAGPCARLTAHHMHPPPPKEASS